MTSFITDLLSADLGIKAPLSLSSAHHTPHVNLPGFLESSGVVSADPMGGRHVMLRPGDWLFGRGSLRVTAVLGASVALVMWIPRFRLGAVSCFAHPQRPGGVYGLEGSSGMYGEDAVRWLGERLDRTSCDWSDVTLSLAGGAQQQDGCAGERNVRWAQAWAADQAIEPVQQDVGGRVLRKLSFNLADGSLTIAHGGRLGAPEV